MDSKKAFFEEKIREATPKVLTHFIKSCVSHSNRCFQDPRKGNVKPVGQRDWTPNPVGAWTPPNYTKQVGGGFQSSTQINFFLLK
jgi:hypothetical protein